VNPRPGDKVLHRYNSELGPGEVVAVAGGRMRIRFPRSGQTLEFSVLEHAFTPLILPEGTDPERWHETFHEDLVERLARLETDRLGAWENRMDALRLRHIREAGGLGTFLGGRIEIFPHQLHVAEQAVAADPVRWLLADEVGLGKTVEACLILSHLMRARRAERVLIVAPASLTVQWLGELYRKFHQVFVLLDRERRQDVRKDFGPGFNPFEVHPRSLVSLEDLVGEAHLSRFAETARPDLLVVDEAHRLERRTGHPGSPAYRALAPLCAASRHVLLLSATPLEADTHGFFRLLELLHPERYDSVEAFDRDLENAVPLLPCTSSTRRDDIGGLPPRVPRPVPLPDWPDMQDRERDAMGEAPTDALEIRRRAERLERAWSEPTGEDDPRLRWILEQAPRWHANGDKILLFVHRRESLEFLKTEIERTTLRRVAVFHEDLPPATQDLEVAQFALPHGPNLLLSTEAGGEGRNFQFCRGLVLFDLPHEPVLIEQRIGRLDRINRRRPVEITYFVPTGGFGAQLVRLYEALGVFQEPLGGLERSLEHVEQAILTAMRAEVPRLDIPSLVRETHDARGRMRRAVFHHLHQDRYHPSLAPGILSRIPPDLEDRTARVVLEACQQFGFEVLSKRGRDTWYLEFGHEATIEHLPGVPEGSRWLGTFNREEAVERETLDFFASGHPLVEGILMELEDGHRGQVALLAVDGTGVSGQGLALVVRRRPERPGRTYETLVVDMEGTPRPEWGRFLTEEPGRRRPVRPADAALAGPEASRAWSDVVRRRLYPLQSEGKSVAAAAFWLAP
jgi:ATP-dependent helicase HepA